MKIVLQKRSFVLIAGLLFCLALLMAACAPEPPATGTGGGTGTTPTTTSQSTAVIHTASASVKGTSTTVLTDSKGMTLYYFTPDTLDTVACTGDCASTWPPELFTGTGTPGNDASLPGTLSTHSNTNGNQILYNNHYLYTFSGDSAAGQANGQGIGGKWFVATPDLK